MSNICYVVNETGQNIHNLSVQKFLGGNPDGGISQALLNLNETISFTFNGGSGSDTWTLSFTLDDGTTHSRSGKQCDVSSDDLASQAGVYLNLLASTTGFSIETPVSSGCTDNHYD